MPCTWTEEAGLITTVVNVTTVKVLTPVIEIPRSRHGPSRSDEFVGFDWGRCASRPGFSPADLRIVAHGCVAIGDINPLVGAASLLSARDTRAHRASTVLAPREPSSD